MFSLTIHVKVLHCSWQRTPPVIATMSFFFCKNKIFEPKGFSFKKKKFYDKTMFIYLRTCIHMYTNIHTCIITVFLLAILKKKYFSWQRTAPTVVTVFLFFLKKKTWEKNRVFAYIFTHIYTRAYTYIHIYVCAFICVYIYMYIHICFQENNYVFFF